MLANIHIQTYIVILAFIFGCIVRSNIKKFELIILVILGLNVFCDLYVTAFLNTGQNNHIYYSVLTLIEGILILLMYSQFFNSKLISKFLHCVIPLLIIYGLYNLFYLQGFYTLNTYTFAPLGIIIMIFSYLMIREYIGTISFNRNNLILWFAIACFIYYGIGVLNICLTIWAQQNKIPFAHNLLILNDILYGIFSFLLILGFSFKIKNLKG